jgi:hypothetical protein
MTKKKEKKSKKKIVKIVGYLTWIHRRTVHERRTG